jgi:hypothetical protein
MAQKPSEKPGKKPAVTDQDFNRGKDKSPDDIDTDIADQEKQGAG